MLNTQAKLLALLLGMIFVFSAAGCSKKKSEKELFQAADAGDVQKVRELLSSLRETTKAMVNGPQSKRVTSQVTWITFGPSTRPKEDGCKWILKPWKKR